MTVGEAPPDRGARYHHGDLRRALLEAACAILAETGRWDFSLREVARRANVSHNAPYRHFADKEALLSEIGVLGYERLREAGERAVGDRSSPREVLAALGSSYVRFGVEHPALYRLMFGQALSRPDGLAPALLDAVQVARGVLRDIILAGARDGSFRVDATDADAVMSASVGAWSLVHGLTSLMIDNVVQRDTRDESLAHLPERVVELFVAGLEHRADEPC